MAGVLIARGIFHVTGNNSRDDNELHISFFEGFVKRRVSLAAQFRERKRAFPEIQKRGLGIPEYTYREKPEACCPHC